ncbi:MAG: biopolymer transporter ExbD [Verrucomicrobia bacterium]|jgi:biopolymer transport protein ExbD|nr:biopolymer transporter ExbD [Verrucomicrobiota bacterium]MBT7065496.1 biopolymer transporter ExbD [Verrucomicrobiota bacterium]MBT7698893.1 biopolymer transporter ExbD [Verrucomicrobiota bacterium]
MKIALDTESEPELDIASLIDMVFLLLIYFMVTASLVKSEGDLGLKLPGVVQQSVAVDMPDEQIIEIRQDSRVFLNGRVFGEEDQQEMPDLVDTLQRYRMASEAAKNRALITIWAHDEVRHQRVIDVMNACAFAGIEDITFTASM